MSHCQICNHSPLRHVISLGYMPPVNWMMPIDEPAKEQTWLPTDLMYCPKCELVQLDYIADSEVVFPEHYPYTSGSTKILRDNFADLAREAKELLELKPGNKVLDIGSNDGTLLAEFKSMGMDVFGIEPTDIADIAKKKGIPTLKTFFDESIASAIAKNAKADLITCTNCFAHMPNINDVMTGIKALLKPQGTFISESHYLIDLLNGVQYDTIYHEHLRYYSLCALERLFDRHDMKIFAAKKIGTHGGSTRVYVCHRRLGNQRQQSNVSKLINAEPTGDKLTKALDEFAEHVIWSRWDFWDKLTDHVAVDKTDMIVGVGAPSRGTILINYLGLSHNDLSFVAEREGSLKIGRYIPGTHIPVVAEDWVLEQNPDYALILSWHIADAIMQNWRTQGYKGKFIIPLPEPTIVD